MHAKDTVAPGGKGATDEDLLDRARHGDGAALEALLVRYQPRIYRYGISMCRDPEDAGDIAQETLFAMARSVNDFRGESSVGSWLFTIARRFCMKKRRRGKFAPVREHSLEALEPHDTAQLSDSTANPEQTAAAREIHAALTSAIEALEPGQREVLLLRDVEGLSAPDVAKVLGISVQAVKSRLHRARVALRRQMSPLLGELPASPPSSQCPDVLRMFSHHLEGDIAPETCAQMEAHLERCGHCHQLCESLKSTLASCRAIEGARVPPEVVASVKAAVRAFVDRHANR